MYSRGLIDNWYVIVGIDMKGSIKFKELFDSTLENIEKKVDKLNVVDSGLTYFGYKIKKSELL